MSRQADLEQFICDLDQIIREYAAIFLAETPWPEGARVIVTTRPDKAAASLEGFAPFDLLPYDRVAQETVQLTDLVEPLRRRQLPGDG